MSPSREIWASISLSSEILHALGSPVQDLSTVLQGHESNIHLMSHLQIYLRVSQMTIDVSAVKINSLGKIISGT